MWHVPCVIDPLSFKFITYRNVASDDVIHDASINAIFLKRQIYGLLGLVGIM